MAPVLFAPALYMLRAGYASVVSAVGFNRLSVRPTMNIFMVSNSAKMVLPVEDYIGPRVRRPPLPTGGVKIGSIVQALTYWPLIGALGLFFLVRVGFEDWGLQYYVVHTDHSRIRIGVLYREPTVCIAQSGKPWPASLS